MITLNMQVAEIDLNLTLALTITRA